jgi:predicted nucleic acid-binding protein
VLLLDTDAMVDVLRGYEPAVEWLRMLTEEAPALPGFVVLELMDGCRSKMEMKRFLKRVITPGKSSNASSLARSSRSQSSTSPRCS